VDGLETEVACWCMYSAPSHNNLPLQPCSKNCPSCPSSLSLFLFHTSKWMESLQCPLSFHSLSCLSLAFTFFSSWCVPILVWTILFWMIPQVSSVQVVILMPISVSLFCLSVRPKHHQFSSNTAPHAPLITPPPWLMLLLIPSTRLLNPTSQKCNS